jgi:hypothetical protein
MMPGTMRRTRATTERSRRRTAAGSAAADDARDTRLAEVAQELRAALAATLRAAAGADPRPMQLSRVIGIDKSLASVLVRAVKAPTDLALLQLIPSPTGLRILSARARGVAPRAAIARLEAATESFRRLLDATPGGRAALDARISEGARALGRRREHTSRQSTFKAVSFLVGYFSDLLTSSLFVIPSKTEGMLDGIEIMRRTGVRRMRASATVPLFSFEAWPEDVPPEHSSHLEPIDGDRAAPSPSNVLLPAYCSQPMPEVIVVREGVRTTVILPGGGASLGPMDFAWAFRLRNGGPADAGTGTQAIHGYYLHMPTRRLVRDLYVHRSVFPGASPSVSFALPGTEASRNPPREGTPAYYAQIDLAVELEPIPESRPAALPGVPGHEDLTRHVLDRAGYDLAEFRGWRCVVEYPVPLITMLFWFTHPPRKA